MNSSKTFTAVIAAAGLSSRMGAFKPTLPLGNDSISRRLILAFIRAGSLPVTVVTGFMAETLGEHLKDLPVRLVHNKNYETSHMFDSLSLGLRSLTAANPVLPDKIFLCPADMPLISPETISLMAGQESGVIIPVCEGRKGHPVCISKALVPALLSHDGTDGLRGALKPFSSEIFHLPVDDAGILTDADTMEDYRKIRELFGEVDS